MMKDKAIEEVHAVRKQISEDYRHDIKTFLEHYRELESQYKERLVYQFPPLKPTQDTADSHEGDTT
jgi:hypothetical protein